MSYVGLCRQVRYVEDLGYIFADDGKRTFRFEKSFFDKLSNRDFASDETWLIDFYPSLFRLFASREEARASFLGKEIEDGEIVA